MSNTELFDAIIIGAGPIGIATAIAFEKAGISYVLIEKGCIVNSIFHYPINMTFFSTSERLEIGGVPFISHGAKPTRREALEYYRRVVSAFKLNIRTYEEVEVIEKDGFASLDPLYSFKVRSSKGEYASKNLVLSTGFYDTANMMNIPGEDLPKVKHYYDEPHPYAYQKVVVVGGGNSAVDAALETYRCHAEVTLVVRENSLKDGVKYWVRPDIDNRIKEGSIKAHFNAKILQISKNSVLVEDSEGKRHEIENDIVLAMTGYQPNYGFLTSLGVELTEGNARIPKYNEESLETNIKGLYLAGVICGGMETGRWFIENTRDHGDKIAAAILGNKNT
jgi:putative YpdA family bacillithiol system oxidoreductase